MKLSWKLFFLTYIMVMLLTGIGGFVLVESMTRSVMDEKIEAAAGANKYISESLILMADTSEDYPDSMKKWLKNLKDQNNLEYAELDTETDLGAELDNQMQGRRFIEKDGKRYLQLVTRIDINQVSYYVETRSDFSEYDSYRGQLVRMYQLTVLVIAFVIASVLLVVAHYHTKALEEAVKDRDTFVANFTHELKTPMTSIIGYADLLRSYDCEADERRALADVIYREARRLESLSVQLLAIMVLKNSKGNFETIDAAVFFRVMNTSLQALAKKYRVAVELDYEEASFVGDKSLLTSLICNLVDNAGKACEENGNILVTGRSKGGSYVISVKDDGRGMTEEILERITEPFYMEDKARSRKQGGAGLGLSFCRMVAELHGSQLEFQSAPGCGTTVCIRLRKGEKKR